MSEGGEDRGKPEGPGRRSGRGDPTAGIPTIPPPPALSTAQMREVDRVMIEDLDISLVQMMENAGRNLALLALRRFRPRRVTVLAGPGGNGGGGLAAARHLLNRGIDVRVSLSRPTYAFDPVPAHQARILSRLGVDLDEEPATADLVIDTVVGYSISGDPRGRAAELIAWANGAGTPILSLDAPSGLDLTTGRAGSPTIAAAATMTLALPKLGLDERPDLVGELYLGDISVPPSVYRTFGIEIGDLFGRESVVRIEAR